MELTGLVEELKLCLLSHQSGRVDVSIFNYCRQNSFSRNCLKP